MLEKAGIPVLASPSDGVPPAFSGKRDRIGQDSDVAVIFATSGTTGAPKAVPLTHENLYDNTKGVHQTIEGFDKGRVLMNVLPNFHSFGYTVCSVLPLLWGLPEALHPGFIPLKNLFEGLRDSGTGILIAVPTKLPFILGAASKGEKIPPELRYILTGGGKLDPLLEKRFRDQLGVITYEGYGLTECSPVVSCNPSDALRKTGTDGPPLPSYTVEVRGDVGCPVPPGQDGEVWLKGPSVAGGYFRDPELSAERFHDGWIDTGDMVGVDEDGYISILDRDSDMIIVGGFNVYPQEVETVIKEIPGVKEAVVVGVSNPVSGEVPMAFVIKDEAADLEGNAIIAYCKEKNGALQSAPQGEVRDGAPAVRSRQGAQTEAPRADDQRINCTTNTLFYPLETKYILLFCRKKNSIESEGLSVRRMTFLVGVVCAAFLFLSLRPADTVFACVACGDDDGAVLSFSKIAGGSYGGVKERSFLVLSNEEDWKALWSRINGNVQPLPPLPEVDFATHAVVAVFQGRKNSGGYSIAVEAVVEMADRVTVTVRECEPGPSSIVTSALSSPWEAVVLPLPAKPVLFTSVN